MIWLWYKLWFDCVTNASGVWYGEMYDTWSDVWKWWNTWRMIYVMYDMLYDVLCDKCDVWYLWCIMRCMIYMWCMIWFMIYALYDVWYVMYYIDDEWSDVWFYLMCYGLCAIEIKLTWLDLTWLDVWYIWCMIHWIQMWCLIYMIYDVMHDVWCDVWYMRWASVIHGVWSGWGGFPALQLYPGPVVVSMSQPGGNHGNSSPAHTRPIAVLYHQWSVCYLTNALQHTCQLAQIPTDNL